MQKIFYEKVGKRLREAREENNITLEEAGKTVDVHKSTVLRWENGETEKIKLPILETLAKLYKVNPLWLMGHDVEKQEENSFRFASYKGIDTNGLNEDEIKEIKQFVEFIKNKKGDN